MAKPKNFVLLFFKVLFVVGGSILTTYSLVTTFVNIPPIIQDWRIGVGFGLLGFFIGMSWIVFDLYRRYVWGSEPDIEITTHREHFDVQGYTAAWLNIKNMEQMDITSCYARLMSADVIYYVDGIERKNPVIPSLVDKKIYRIKWNESEFCNEKCEITIPRNDSRVLSVAVTDNLRGLRLNLFEKDIVPNWMGKEILCAVQIRIDGCFNGKPMKPQLFDGFISVETETVGYSDGVVRGNILIYKLMFAKKGDWMKSKKLEEKLKKASTIL